MRQCDGCSLQRRKAESLREGAGPRDRGRGGGWEGGREGGREGGPMVLTLWEGP